MSIVRNAFFVCLLAAALASAAVDPALLNLVMPDAKFISGIQVDTSKNSAFGKYVLSQMQSEDPGFAKFIADTGFDPRRDLTEIVAGATGASDNPMLLVVGSGSFNPGAIANAAQAHGASVANYGGFTVITHATRGSSQGALTFLSASLAAMGTQDAVYAAIDRYKSGATLPSALAAKANQLAAANDAWFVSTGPVSDFFTGKMANTKAGGAMQANLLQAILAANGGIKFGASDIRISGEALTRSAKDASALADVVRFLAGMIQLNKDSNPQAQKLATLLDAMTLATSDATMTISLTMPESLVEQLFVPSGAAAPKRVQKRAAIR
ncbi:MAG: hypothetical protein JSU00_30150 [Acidobacteria bacterium]|nr:hypothetical protein [Acidobacteriota bacterium]